MFTSEIVLITLGLAIAFFSRGHRRILFHVSITFFLIAFALGSVPLVIGGIAILGLGLIDGTLSIDRQVRWKVYAVTAALLVASVTLPTSATWSNRSETVQARAIPPEGNFDLADLDQRDLMQFVSENQEAVNEIANDLLGNLRRRVAQVANQSDGLEIETTIDFKAPAKLLEVALSQRALSEEPVSGEAIADGVNADSPAHGRLKLHAALNDARDCNQCHDVGGSPLHAKLDYEWTMGDETIQSDTHTIPLDPSLIVHAN